MRSFVVALAALAFASAAHAGGGGSTSTANSYGYRTPCKTGVPCGTTANAPPPGHPVCPAKTKLCGNACIAQNKVCHP
jgi:hypothetical protein